MFILFVFFHFFGYPFGEVFQLHAAQVSFAMLADRNSAFGSLLLAHNHHIRDMLHFGITDFATRLFTAIIDIAPEFLVFQKLLDFLGVIQVLFADRQYRELHRRKP